jgi:hypothetical protein
MTGVPPDDIVLSASAASSGSERAENRLEAAISVVGVTLLMGLLLGLLLGLFALVLLLVVVVVVRVDREAGIIRMLQIHCVSFSCFNFLRDAFFFFVDPVVGGVSKFFFSPPQMLSRMSSFRAADARACALMGQPLHAWGRK